MTGRAQIALPCDRIDVVVPGRPVSQGEVCESPQSSRTRDITAVYRAYGPSRRASWDAAVISEIDGVVMGKVSAE
jgi:hypothetical protein